MHQAKHRQRQTHRDQGRQTTADTNTQAKADTQAKETPVSQKHTLQSLSLDVNLYPLPTPLVTADLCPLIPGNCPPPCLHFASPPPPQLTSMRQVQLKVVVKVGATHLLDANDIGMHRHNFAQYELVAVLVARMLWRQIRVNVFQRPSTIYKIVKEHIV